MEDSSIRSGTTTTEQQNMEDTSMGSGSNPDKSMGAGSNADSTVPSGSGTDMKTDTTTEPATDSE
jgi:hypothetical protein